MIHELLLETTRELGYLGLVKQLLNWQQDAVVFNIVKFLIFLTHCSYFSHLIWSHKFWITGHCSFVTYISLAKCVIYTVSAYEERKNTSVVLICIFHFVCLTHDHTCEYLNVLTDTHSVRITVVLLLL